MAKRKLTEEILETIELCAADEYTLDEIREEADIIRPLMEDPQVQEAIEKGRVKWFVEIIATDGDIDLFIYYSRKTMHELGEMYEAYEDAIKARKDDIEHAKNERKLTNISNAKSRLSPSNLGSFNLLIQDSKETREKIDQATLKKELELVVKKMQGGDTTSLLELLTSNIMQLHYFNAQVTGNLAGDLGKPLDNFKKLSDMQLKVMQETRKSIMAINEICNPKRTTFVKEANQHNHLHQNSEKKDGSENELQKPEQLQETETITEAEVIPIKEKAQ